LLAEELEVDLSAIQIEQAPTKPLQRDLLRFGIEVQDDDELQDHHGGEEKKWKAAGRIRP